MFFLFFLCLASADDSLLRIEERLTTNKEFYDSWMDLVSLQAQQLEEQLVDYPMNYILDDIEKCGRSRGKPQDSAEALRLEDIGIYAEMGHISTYCASNLTLLKEGMLDSCAHRASSMSLPSMDKMLRIRSPNLTVITANERDELLSEQARHLAEVIKQNPNHSSIWKMILIIPSIQDGEASETGQTAVEVLSSIEELNRLLPQKTFIVVVRSSGSGIWRDASHSHKACRSMLQRWRIHNKYNYNSVWDQVDMIVEKNFIGSNFTVEILPLMRDAALVNLPSEVDLSPLGYDCAHFSERGLSLLHLSIWNALMTRSAERTHQYRPQTTPVVCPDPRCPYIRTAANSAYCIWTAEEAAPESIAPRLIVIAVLLLAILLALIVLFFACRRPRRTKDFKKPIKAFGSSFSSIKFIDEDL